MATNPRPTVRRLKTYTSTQGYVYQYYFVGKRPAIQEQGTSEYIFDVSSDRKTTFAVSVFLPDEVLHQWAATHGRSVNEAEQYGAVKMRLLRAFDDVENMIEQGRSLRLDRETLEDLLGALGIS